MIDCSSVALIGVMYGGKEDDDTAKLALSGDMFDGDTIRDDLVTRTALLWH